MHSQATTDMGDSDMAREHFASVEDLETFWRPLTPEEIPRAEALLESAQAIILSQCPAAEAAAPAVLRYVVCDMVKFSMATPPVVGAESFSQGAGPYSAQINFANPGGGLLLSRQHRLQLGCDRQRAFTVRLGGD